MSVKCFSWVLYAILANDQTWGGGGGGNTWFIACQSVVPVSLILWLASEVEAVLWDQALEYVGLMGMYILSE